MRKRLLALLLALVLMVGMLPTAFATDAVEPAAVGEELDTENPAEGENEEMPEEPEETGAEEEAKAEAEAAPLAADASGTVAYLLGMRLENGYYTANKAEVGHYTEKPDSLKNYLFYEDGVLTVFGGIVVGNSGTEDWKAVLSVESGSLTIKGSGILKLNGTGMSGLYVDRNHADINIDLAEGDALGQISIKSTNACTVRGDLTVTNASFAEIATDIDRNADTTIICDTIDGGFADLKSAALKSIIMADGELQWYNDVYQTDALCLFSICGGKAEIQENSNFYGMMDVSGGEVNISNSMVYGYEEMWLSQTGGTVNVRNSELHNAAMLGGGELYINGSTLQSDFSGTDCVYLGGGEAVVTNTKVLANPTEPENGEESRIIHSSVHMDGGRLTLDNSPLFGSLVINAGAALELKNGSNVKTEAATAIMASGEVHITDCDVRGKQIGLLVTGGKKASAMLHSGEVSGKEAGVLVDGGSFTMDGGTPKSTVKISGGEINADETALFAKQGSSVSLSGGTFTAGQNALAAGESTMKGWLAKGYDMIGADLPGGFDPAKASETGAGTVMIVTEDGEPAQSVMDMIDEIGKVELTDECERKILDAEEAYEMLTAAQQKKVTNYKTLLKARQTYDKQVAEREYAEQAGYVNYLMEEIPADMEKIESSTLSVIREAEEAYNEAAKDKNVKKYLDNDLVKRLKTARKTYDKNEKAAGKVQELIDDLPAPEELTYAKDRKSVAKAQTRSKI